MPMKKLIFSLLIIIFGGVTALFGAVAGGMIVYQYVRQQDTSQIASTQSPIEVVPASNESQNMVVNTTDVETTITQAVQNIGPAVVTGVATIPVQQTFFGRT